MLDRNRFMVNHANALLAVYNGTQRTGTGATVRYAKKLEREHILYVLDCLKNTTAKIGNIKAYTLAALYNAPVTIEQYYDVLVSRGFA